MVHPRPKFMLQSLLRHFGYEVRRAEAGYDKPIDLFNLLVQQRIKERGKSFFFVQIGANDGKTHDPIHPLILKYGLRGILVEPLPDFFARLQINYKGNSNLIFENVAIGSCDGSQVIYRVNPTAEVRDDAHCLASFDRNNLLRAADRVPGIAKYIQQILVPTITIRTLIERHNVSEVDLLQIDTEGFDAHVIRMTLESGLRPWIINYEIANLPLTVQKATRGRLAECGYRYLNHAGGGETIALRIDD